MFKKVLFFVLTVIFSVTSALSQLVSPTTIFGDYTKCTIRYLTGKSELSPYELDLLNGGYDKTKIINIEAQYDKNKQILSEVAKYDDNSPKQSIIYKYDDKGLPLEISLYNKNGELFVQKIFINKNDTILVHGYCKVNSKDSIFDQRFFFDTSKQIIAHNTMNNNGEDYDYHSMYNFIVGNDTYLTIHIYLSPNLKSVNNPKGKDKPKTVKYDNKGGILEETYQDSDNDEFTFTDKYDDRGRLIETAFSKTDGVSGIKTTYQYNTDGSKTIYDRVLHSDNYLKSINRYDKEGRLYESIELLPDGNQKSLINRKFDSKNRIIEVTKVNTNDKDFSKRDFEYDKFGNCIKRTTYSKDNTIMSSIEFAYSK